MDKAVKVAIKRVDPLTLETIRAAVDAAPTETDWFVRGLANIRAEMGTGRARCRDCGQLIARGVSALRFGRALGEYSYNVTVCYIHRTPCAPERLSRRQRSPEWA